MNHNDSLPSTAPSSWLLTLSLALGVLGCDPAGGVDERSVPTAAEEEPGEPTDDGCTLTQGYWKNHHATAKNPSQQQPWPVDEGTALCEQTWLEILQTPPKGDAWIILAHQWIAASLNVAAGAVPPPDVADAIAAAADILADCQVDAGEHAAALAASSLLDDFNNGVVGPGHCGDGGTGGGDDGGDTDGGGETTGGSCGESTDTGDTFSTDWPIPQ